jgi:hypothetical protein
MGRSPGRRSTRSTTRPSLLLLLLFVGGVASFTQSMWSHGAASSMMQRGALLLLRSSSRLPASRAGRLLGGDGMSVQQQWQRQRAAVGRSFATSMSAAGGERGRLEYDVIVVGG